MTNEERRPAAITLDPATRARLAALVDRLGEAATCERLGVPHTLLARGVAGFRLRRGNAERLETRLDVLEALLAAEATT